MSGPQRRQSVSLSTQPLAVSPVLATSPPAFSSFSASYEARQRATGAVPFPQQGKALAPFKEDGDRDEPVRILLLENINVSAVDMLKAQGYHVEEQKKALGEDELIAKLKEGGFSAVGIRSKTKITAKVIQEVPSVRAAVLLVPSCAS